MAVGTTISKELVAEVRNRTDIVAVIGRHVVLRKEGPHYAGPCPFHPEKPGIIKVFTDTKRFKCFTCGEGGDVLAFVQKQEGLSFPVAVRKLALSVSVDIPEPELSAEQKRARAERAELITPTKLAVEWWQERLWGEDGAPARDFLASRGITEETARAFQIGYAPAGWHGLHGALKAKGVSVASMQRAGLLVDKGDVLKTYDRFRDRVMFPIYGPDGHVVGFGGRVLTFDPAARAGDKYVVGPATALFRPSRALYAIDRAKAAIRSTKTAVLVEGYLDALALHQAGYANAVAVGAFALTDDQVAVLRSQGAERLVILNDGGSEGGAAPATAAEAILRVGVEGVVSTLPSPGAEDLALFVRAKGREGVEAVMAKGRPLTEWLLEQALRQHCPGDVGQASAEQRLRALRSLLPYVSACQDDVLRNLLIKRISKRFELDIGVLRAELDKSAKTKAR
jgi:DNA primase